MGPKKKIKMSEETEHILENNTEIETELYLSKLPNEMLAKIYQYLSPVDLLSLQQLGQRFVEVTSYLKEANFSSCRKEVNFEVSAFFSKLNVKYIQKLNFNYNIFVSPLVLTELICRCKNLTKLSIVECGMKYNHVIKILQSCTKLEELSWNISRADRTLNACCPTLKSLYLFCVTGEADYSIYLTIMNFPEVKNVFLNFSPDLLSVYPYHGVLLKSFIKTNKHSRRYIIINGSSLIVNNSRLFKMLPLVEEANETDSSKSPNIEENGVYSCSSDLQFQSKEKDISSLMSSGSFNAYSSVTIILTPEVLDQSESLAKCVEKVAGNKLNHLTLQFESCDIEDPLELPLKSPFEDQKVCVMFKNMLLSCPNITVLNIANVHFNMFSPFSTICLLRNLKTLNVSSCCFNNHQSVRNLWNLDTKIDLSPLGNKEIVKVVKSCSKVENFSLLCCREASYQINADDMNFMKEWRELKHLTIYNLMFRTFKFLRRIADSCKQLESLSLISDISSNVCCLFTDDVIYVLKTAKNLSLIRINDRRFNPMFERFLDSIEGAVNLEGICIATNSKVPIVKKAIIKAINKLKYLHLFHFFHPNAPESLYSEVRKSMNKHGVKNTKIESNCITALHLLTDLPFYHKQSYIWCKYMHLKSIHI